MAIPWIKVAGTIYQLGKVLLTGKELTEQASAILKDRRRALDQQEMTAGRVQQLEEALAKQMELNRQHQIQTELLRSALEDLQKSLRLIVITASLAILLSLAALLFALFK